MPCVPGHTDDSKSSDAGFNSLAGCQLKGYGMTEEELLKKIEVLEQAGKFNHDNLMILERDRQKAWEENKLLKKEIQELKNES